MNMRQIAKPVKGKNTRLAGKIKCTHCGHALSLRMYPRKRTVLVRYCVCSIKYISASCNGIGAVQASDIEDIVFDGMRRKLAEFTELSVKERQGDPSELTKLKVRADEIEKEIATLIDKIVSASPAMMEYINERIDVIDEEKKGVREQIAQMSAEMYGKRNMETIVGYINNWERINIDDKRIVVDAMIDTIWVGQGDVQIPWKI